MQTKTIFHQCKTSYNTGVVVQDNAAQQWWYSTILTANTFQILVNLLKWYIQIFLVKMVVEVLITLT